MLIHDLYSSMERVIKTVMSRFLCVEAVKSSPLAEVDVTNEETQLSDLELFLGTEIRMELTSVEEHCPMRDIQEFYRFE